MNKIALLDLDETVADYDAAMKFYMNSLRAPEEAPYEPRICGKEPPHIRARRKMIQGMSGFWQDLEEIKLGFDIFSQLEGIGFEIHVLTKGPSQPNAWAEKFYWCRNHLIGSLVTITQEKSIVYGRVLVDDYPPYFTGWLANRPRGLVVCVAQPWNVDYAVGGAKEHPQVLRYDGSNLPIITNALQEAYDRE